MVLRLIVIVTVNPLPDVVAAPNAETICSGATRIST
jgi:hypothetical protein